ncbi:MAG: ParB/RepB/Spo0J family partition protein [Spirochaetaceae bacterium]|nr:ParB/RepB/Spo0J family partition protein [Spirochaetaceae bacterium]
MNSLIGEYSMDFINRELGTDSPTHNSTNEILHLSLDKIIVNPSQPRKHFDETSLNELSLSIQNQGILQPLLVEKLEEDKYSIIAGERRFRAAKIANLTEVPVIVKNFTVIERLEVALIENIQRENLNSLEEAQAYSYLINESGLTQEALAKRVGKNRSTITNSIRLLQLNDKMKQGLEEGKISAGHARALLSLNNPVDRKILESKLLKGDLSVRAAEKIAGNLNKGIRNNPEKGIKNDGEIANPGNRIDPDLQDVQEKFISALGSKVGFKGSINKGKFSISYNSIEELERLFQIISPNGDMYEI